MNELPLQFLLRLLGDLVHRELHQQLLNPIVTATAGRTMPRFSSGVKLPAFTIRFARQRKPTSAGATTNQASPRAASFPRIESASLVRSATWLSVAG
ncbi:MAG: hypothetical protein WCQ77_09570 [Planctomycetota bacterium]